MVAEKNCEISFRFAQGPAMCSGDNFHGVLALCHQNPSPSMHGCIHAHMYAHVLAPRQGKPGKTCVSFLQHVHNYALTARHFPAKEPLSMPLSTYCLCSWGVGMIFDLGVGHKVIHIHVPQGHMGGGGDPTWNISMYPPPPFPGLCSLLFTSTCEGEPIEQYTVTFL
jgi:hypothetical protein